jgi:hypothetical protein
MSTPHDDFAAVLLAREVITPEQLVEAWRIVAQTGVTLQDALVKLGYATSEQVTSAVAEFTGIEYVELTFVTVAPAVVELVPESVARENVVMPLALEGAALRVALSDPSDLATMEKLQFILNMRISPVLAPKEQIVEAINRHYGQSETESVDSMLAEFTDTAIDFTETGATCLMLTPPAEEAKAEAVAGTAARVTERRATVRYYSRMSPERLFPLLVILSRAEVEQVAKRGVRQATSEAFKVAEGSLVEVEPVLPGCDCYPPTQEVRVAGGEVSVTFWVAPAVLGRVMQARVVVRQGGEPLAEVPLDIRVARQGITRLMGALSLVLPFGLMLLKMHGLDFEAQAQEGFGLYAQLAGWLVRSLTPEVLTSLLLAATVGLYLWLRPRRREVFWDIKTRQGAEPVEAATPEAEPHSNDLYGRAKRAFARGDGREGERLLGELLAAKPLHTAALLCLARRRGGGEPRAALKLYERALATGKCGAIDYFRASLVALEATGAARALAILKEAEATLPPGEMKGPLWYNMGCFSARMGRFPDALRYLNKAVDAGFADLEKFRGDPDLGPLRWKPGFRQLLDEIAR